jgi:hypothetical protein
MYTVLFVLEIFCIFPIIGIVLILLRTQALLFSAIEFVVNGLGVIVGIYGVVVA